MTLIIQTYIVRRIVKAYIAYFKGLLELFDNPKLKVEVADWSFVKWHSNNVKFISRGKL